MTELCGRVEHAWFRREKLSEPKRSKPGKEHEKPENTFVFDGTNNARRSDPELFQGNCACALLSVAKVAFEGQQGPGDWDRLARVRVRAICCVIGFEATAHVFDVLEHRREDHGVTNVVLVSFRVASNRAQPRDVRNDILNCGLR